MVRGGFSDATEGGSSAFDLDDDVVDGLGPHERLGVVVTARTVRAVMVE